MLATQTFHFGLPLTGVKTLQLSKRLSADVKLIILGNGRALLCEYGL